jgi:hypothetical protein
MHFAWLPFSGVFLTGGAGSDTFIFSQTSGHDTIVGFVPGQGSEDVLVLGSFFSDFASVLASTTQVGEDTLISCDADNSVTLKGINLTSLHQDDFAAF